MLLPWIVLLLILTAVLIGLAYRAKKRIDAHREKDAQRGRPAL